MNHKNLILFLGLFLTFLGFGGCGEDHISKIESPAQAQETPFPEELNSQEKEFLLKLARKVLESYLENKTLPKINLDNISPVLKKKRGCFVTLEKNHQLRGCIGYLQPRKSLVEAVVENAVSAAVRDHRFPPVTRPELDSLSIEISVLTVPRLLAYESPNDLLAKLVPERDGIIIKNSYHQSTYLPQVWKQIPQKEEFLSRLCLKGGAKADCWKDSKTEIYCYQANVYTEPE
jgi:AmmeMemoRadiSam system protein A